jgi:hypothetical protein
MRIALKAQSRFACDAVKNPTAKAGRPWKRPPRVRGAAVSRPPPDDGLLPFAEFMKQPVASQEREIPPHCKCSESRAEKKRFGEKRIDGVVSRVRRGEGDDGGRPAARKSGGAGGRAAGKRDSGRMAVRAGAVEKLSVPASRRKPQAQARGMRDVTSTSHRGPAGAGHPPSRRCLEQSVPVSPNAPESRRGRGKISSGRAQRPGVPSRRGKSPGR